MDSIIATPVNNNKKEHLLEYYSTYHHNLTFVVFFVFDGERIWLEGNDNILLFKISDVNKVQ